VPFHLASLRNLLSHPSNLLGPARLRLSSQGAPTSKIAARATQAAILLRGIQAALSAQVFALTSLSLGRRVGGGRHRFPTTRRGLLVAYLRPESCSTELVHHPFVTSFRRFPAAIGRRCFEVKAAGKPPIEDAKACRESGRCAVSLTVPDEPRAVGTTSSESV
jgi:hypothetical protein